MKNYSPYFLPSILLFLFPVLLVNCQSTSAVSRERPNFLFIIADDLTYLDIGCYGSPDVKTPNIDKLAAEGLRFTRAFQPAPMCSPTRHALYTGMYPVKTGAYPNHTYVKKGTQSIAHYLKALGYKVGLAGKTHINPPESFPFEYIKGNLGWEGIEAFIKEAGDQPFCLFVCSKEPHTPWDRGHPHAYNPTTFHLRPTQVDTEETREGMRNYFAEITFLDGQVGKCIKLLDKYQKTDETLTIFTSEQGNYFPFAKWTCYDAGLQTAFIAKWPGKIEAGTTTDAMIEYIDVVPTFVELAGGDPIDGLDGKSMLAVLKGEANTHKSYVFAIQTSRGINNGPESYGIRSVRSEQYKYIRNLSPEVPFQNNFTHKDTSLWPSWQRKAETDAFAQRQVYKFQYRPAEELYDILADPHEMKNLADDPTLAEIKSDLRKRLDAWMIDQGDEGHNTEMLALERMWRNRKK